MTTVSPFSSAVAAIIKSTPACRSLVCGTLKIACDIALLVSFRRIMPLEEV